MMQPPRMSRTGFFNTLNGGLWPEHSAQIDLIVKAKAHTLAGIKAKVGVAFMQLHDNSEFPNSMEDGNSEERLALSLNFDLMREA